MKETSIQNQTKQFQFILFSHSALNEPLQNDTNMNQKTPGNSGAHTSMVSGCEEPHWDVWRKTTGSATIAWNDWTGDVGEGSTVGIPNSWFN